MAKEPEPRLENQLNEFRIQLDGELRTSKVISGFLFRDGRDRRVGAFLGGLRGSGSWVYNNDWELTGNPAPPNIDDDDLLKQHTETYRRAIEARVQLLDRIKPVEILGMVRDVWGKGEIKQEEGEATLTYPYLMAEKDWYSTTYTEHYTSSFPGSGQSWTPRTMFFLTGKWIAIGLVMTERIGVNFGNMEFPDPKYLPGNETNPYKCYAPQDAKLREFFVDFYQGHAVTQHIDYNPIPKKIWTRPDNLIIHVTVPHSIVPVEGGHGYYYRTDNAMPAWFDQSASQQQIMDYLSEKLEAQRIDGQLPSQVESLELAKIEELRKRGLFKETKDPLPPYYYARRTL